MILPQVAQPGRSAALPGSRPTPRLEDQERRDDICWSAFST
jgi:hypothetical protein